MKVILFIHPRTELPAVMSPSMECGLSILDIAKKDVPAGRPFKILEDDRLPDGPQEEWVVDPLSLTDGIGGSFQWPAPECEDRA